MSDHRKRFERWRAKLPGNTAYLVDQVLTRVVPQFEARNFAWYPDYAGGDSTQIGANCIPLQRRAGQAWPTVHVLFDKRFRPSFNIEFAALPPVCKRWKSDRYVDIPREIALVFEGPVHFALCQGRKRNYDCQYGYHWFSLSPRRYLDAEIEYLLGLLPELFDLFDRGIPDAWAQRKFGHIAPHVLLLESRAGFFSGHSANKVSPS